MVGDANMGVYELIDFKSHTEAYFRDLWREEYSSKEIYTFDNIQVHFYDNQFDHAFFESSTRNVNKGGEGHKDTLSEQRCSRIMWIRDALSDPTAKLLKGYNNKKKKNDKSRRVCVVCNDYVVVINIYKDGHARFITAFQADNSINKIVSGEPWDK